MGSIGPTVWVVNNKVFVGISGKMTRFFQIRANRLESRGILRF